MGENTELERTTINVSKSLLKDVDAMYKLAGYRSKQEFGDAALTMLMNHEVHRLENQGIDIKAIMKLMKQSNP